MNNHLFVSFDDSDNDPTYASADTVYLVLADVNVDENPCVGEGVMAKCPIIPVTPEEAVAFAHMLGFTIKYNDDGEVVIKTGIYNESKKSADKS